jgi:transcriptional regulator with XRE-family HTH domain
MSVEYLARIEQGTDRHPSASVVNALAEALQLDVAEREHLRHLAKISGDTCAGARTQPRPGVRPAVLAVLEQLEPGIALVENRLGDVLAHTSGFDLIARPIGLLDAEQPNFTRFLFTDPRSRDVFPDWDDVADQRAFDLWLGPSLERATRFSAELAEEAGAEFTRRRHQHGLPEEQTLRWLHPTAGLLHLQREVFELPVGDAQQLVVLLPADDATEASLHHLRHVSAPTRSVG